VNGNDDDEKNCLCPMPDGICTKRHCAFGAADKLKALNETQQKMAFKLQLNASGEVCGEVLRTMYQGGNSSVDIWSVGCTGDREYQISVNRDAEGSNTLTGCRQAILSRARPKGDSGCWVRDKY
jgi:hypothetical protein